MAVTRQAVLPVGIAGQNSSPSVNIPAGTTDVFVSYSGFSDSQGDDFDLLTITLGGQPMTLITKVVQVGDQTASGLYRLTAPPTGVQTLALGWSDAIQEGPVLHVACYSASGAIVVRDAQITRWNLTATNSVAVASTATDLVDAHVASFVPDANANGAPAGSGQTIILDDDPEFQSYNADFVTEDAPGAATTTISGTAAYGTIIAYALYEDAGSPITGSLVAPLPGPTLVALGATNPAKRLSLHASGRYLVDSDGTPVFLLTETCWSGMVQWTLADWQVLVTDLKARGIRAVIVNFIEHKFSSQSPAWRNVYGDLPFSGADFSAMTSAYKARALAVVNLLQVNGIYALLFPAYAGFGGGDEGWDASMQSAGTPALQAYGAEVGALFADNTNVIYVMAGDYDPASHTPMNDVWTGISGVDPDATIVTAHYDRGQPSWADEEAYFTLRLSYPPSGTDWHTQVRQGWQAAGGPFPVYMAETYYIHGPNVPDAARFEQQMWQPFVYGAFGGIGEGNDDIWPGGGVGDTSSGQFQTGQGWEAALSDAARDRINHFAAFVDSHDWPLLLPDFAAGVSPLGANSTFVTAQPSNEGTIDFIASAVASDGSWAMAYVPEGVSPFTIDRTELAGAFDVRWYNPRTGVYSVDGSTRPATGSEVLTAPDANSWVLELVVQSGGGVTGSATIQMPAPVLTASGTLTNRGSAAIQMPAPVLTASGSLTNRGAATIQMPAPVLTASGTAVHTGALVAPMPAPTLVATGSLVNRGSLAFTLPGPTLTAAGQQSGGGGMARFNPEIRVFRPPQNLVNALNAAQTAVGVRNSVVIAQLKQLRGAAVEVGYLGDDGTSILDPGGTPVDTVQAHDVFVGTVFADPADAEAQSGQAP